MMALVVCVGLLAAISLAVATGYGVLRMICALLEAVAGFIGHELMMRPSERYYRIGGGL